VTDTGDFANHRGPERGRRSYDEARNNGNGHFVKTAWVVSILTTIVLALAGAWAAHMANAVDLLNEKLGQALINQAGMDQRLNFVNEELGRLRGQIKK
jgi:hypothetical protein